VKLEDCNRNRLKYIKAFNELYDFVSRLRPLYPSRILICPPERENCIHNCTDCWEKFRKELLKGFWKDGYRIKKGR
jgi:hypothetical protein